MFKWILNLFQIKTLTKENFIKFLVENEACQSGLDWAKAQASARDIIEKCTNNDHLCWLVLTIGGPLGAEYWKKSMLFQAEYDKQVAPLWAEYGEKLKVLFQADKYEEKQAPLWGEYKEKEAQLWAEYLEKCNILAKELCTFKRVQEALVG